MNTSNRSETDETIHRGGRDSAAVRMVNAPASTWARSARSRGVSEGSLAVPAEQGRRNRVPPRPATPLAAGGSSGGPPGVALGDVDTGTGGLVMQGLVGAGTFVVVFWGRVKVYIQSLFSRDKDASQSVGAEMSEGSDKHTDVDADAENRQ